MCHKFVLFCKDFYICDKLFNQKFKTMKPAKIIGNNLKNYRDRFGYSQADIAKLLGVERSTISKYESGEREISIVHLNKLSDLYGVEIEDLVAENHEEQNVGLAFVFRKQETEKEDLESIACFQKVVKNYMKMERILKENENTA